MNTETTGLDPGKDHIVQLSTRLVSTTGSQDYNQLVHPENFATPITATKVHGITNKVASLRRISITQILEDVSRQIEQADIIVGHNVEYDIAIIIAEAKRNGYHNLVATLTHPRFGRDGGRRAAICTRQLAMEYFSFLGESLSLADTKLTNVYQRIFQKELVDAHDAMAEVIACQRVYNHLRSFQLKNGIDFQADIVCFED